MAKPNIPNQKSKYNALNKRLANYVALVRQIYDTLNLEAAKMAESVRYKDEGKEFRFKDYPELTDKVKKLQSSFVSDIGSVIYSGTSQEWKNSNLVQDLVADKVLKTYGAHVNGQKYKIYYQTNSDALKAFQERKDRGMNLSQKIWNQSQNYKTELEYAISTAIQKGTSAVTLSKRISKYLLDFKSLQKDYKAKYGKAVDCHDCEYRSIRLARSEINLAYRTAEQKRWEQMDFVVGQEIKLSNNHTCNGVPFTDICDDLKGKYPKDFKFTGWHPACRCYVIPILKTEDEFWAEGNVASQNNVDDIPPQFKGWISDNSDRIKKAKAKGTLPYFVKENTKYVKLKIPQDAAKIRHAKRDEDAIRRAARNRYLLDVANVDNRMIANLRKHAQITGVDISEFNDYIYCHRFDEYNDLITDAESVKLEKLFNKHQSMVLAKYKEFDKKKDEIRSIINGHYEYGNYSETQRKILNSLELSRSLPYNEGLKQLEKFQKDITLEYDRYTKSPVKVKATTLVDTFDLDASTTYHEKYEASINMLSKIYGDKYINNSLYKQITSEFNKSGDFGKAFDIFREKYDLGLKDVFLSVNKIEEIRNADLRLIHRPWIAKFNDYIERINIWNIEKDGYIGIYQDIEGAYNILRLSTDKAAIKYGLNKLSINTPFGMLEEYKKLFGDRALDLIAKKEFYDSFEKFIPFVSRENVNTSFFDPKYNHVFFGIDYRIKESNIHALRLQYHEFGHAMDITQGGWNSYSKWTNLFDKYADEFNSSKEVLFDGSICYGAKFKDKYWNVFAKIEQTLDNEEIAGELSDIFVAFDKNHEWFGHRAHSAKYFNSKQSCLLEFIAHAAESYWVENPIFAEVMPSLYKEIRELYEEFFLRFKNKKI